MEWANYWVNGRIKKGCNTNGNNMAGDGNRYGHPYQETITALTNVGAKISGPDASGTIVIASDGKQYSVVGEK